MGLQLTSAAKYVPASPDSRVTVYAVGNTVSYTDTAGNSGTITAGGSLTIGRGHYFTSAAGADLEIVDVPNVADPDTDRAFSVVATSALWVSVGDAAYGATGDGATDDRAAIQAAIDAANTAGGGTVFFPRGTYIVGAALTIYSNVHMLGSGIAATTIKLKNSANTDIIKTYQFDTLTGTNTSAGPSHFSIERLSINGNRANNTSGRGVAIYGSAYVVDRVHIYDCKDRGYYSEWYSGGTDMEANVSRFKIQNCGGGGIKWAGPHDSCVGPGQIFWDGNFSGSASGYSIDLTASAAAATLFDRVHCWGTAPAWHAYISCAKTSLEGCVFENASTGQVFMGGAASAGSETTMSACDVFSGGVGSGGIGIQVGDGSTGPKHAVIHAKVEGCTEPLKLLTDAGYNDIQLAVTTTSAGVAPYSGTPTPSTRLVIVADNASGGVHDYKGAFNQPSGGTFIVDTGTGLDVKDESQSRLKVDNTVNTAATAVVSIREPTGSGANRKIISIVDTNSNERFALIGRQMRLGALVSSPYQILSVAARPILELDDIGSSAVNSLGVGNAATGSGGVVYALGSDTDIDVAVTPKGTGGLKVNNGPVKLASYTTGGRPTAASAGAGGVIYDSTLALPVFSDGTNWKNFAGTIV